jgi:uncharacterized protein with von Willebrand factor type A (vWA) domain
MWLFQYTFEPFLRALTKELGYQTDIGKLKDLWQWVNTHDWSAEGASESRLYRTVRCFFLEKKQDEPRFQALFERYVIEGLVWFNLVLNHSDNLPPVIQAESTPAKPGEQEMPGDSKKPRPRIHTHTPIETEPPDEIRDETNESGSKTEFFNGSTSEESEPEAEAHSFLFTNDFMPLSSREMQQGWRYLRDSGEKSSSDELDVEATTSRMAENGFFSDLIYLPETLKLDTHLVILIDRRGSMVPFHQLCDQIVAAALENRSRIKPEVYYFYNCPKEYVYSQANLSTAVELPKLYATMQKRRTHVLIISDAGAARGNRNTYRLNQTMQFLKGNESTISQSSSPLYPGLLRCAHSVAWLNPMPRHRWSNSTALDIYRNGSIQMFPLMEEGKLSFVKTIQSLMGKI